MKRRDFLQGAAAVGAGGLATPALLRRSARAADPSVLRFVPQANLANLDPVWGTQYVVRNASLLIWDTLFGVDHTLTPKPQMVDTWAVTDGGNTWTFKLRPGLKFHDNTPVTSKDVTASLTRWMVRDPMGQLISAQLLGMDAVDDATFRIRMSKPFPKLPYALGKNNAPVPFIMPAAVAATDPFKQIASHIGSGPMRFRDDLWVPGSKAIFERFDGYVPRPEAADWMSGGKVISFDRIEWVIMPDAATASAALQNGEIDWWETPIPDVVPLLKRNPGVRVDIADPLGNVGSFRMNHLYPPFSDVRARRAVQMALSQTDYMEAIVGEDHTLWQPMPSFFTPGTALYTEAGGEPLKGPRRVDEARQLLKDAGYAGEKIVLVVGTDQPIVKAEGDVTADLLGRLGLNVDYVAVDWGTVGTLRARKDPPGKGGWNIFHTWHAGADCVNPAPYTGLVTSGDKAWFGWPKNDEIMSLIGQWYNAPDLAAEKQSIAAINKASMDFVTYIPTGFFLAYQAWRSNLTGVVRAPFPVFWDVKKA
jgi:peptide/nickel transport system substrate-binding protein